MTGSDAVTFSMHAFIYPGVLFNSSELCMQQLTVTVTANSSADFLGKGDTICVSILLNVHISSNP